jgi:hypothetical protein
MSLQIPSSKAATMSYLQLLVSTGYRYWIRGEMHFSKAEAFANKVSKLYNLDATQSQRATLKRKGIASARLVMFAHDHDKTKIQFWLLATAGRGFIHERENLSDALTTPLTWRDQYHLTKIQRESKNGGKITWSWIMQNQYFKDQLSMTKSVADSGQSALKDYFGRISHMPMFSGIRDQVKLLDDYGRKTWGKQRKSAYPQVLPVKLPSMPKIEVFKDLTLSDLVKQMGESECARIKNASILAAEIIENVCVNQAPVVKKQMLSK